MDELAAIALIAGGALLVRPVRRRVLSTATAAGRAGLGVVGATLVGTRDIIGAAIRGAPAERTGATAAATR